MGLRECFQWYQNKIGKYDKKKWETTIEQKILYGLTNIQMKSTTLNRDFIDLDLVRGSTFTKNKPKQGFLTVARLATLRCFLLPFYVSWWTQQTSLSIALVILCIYLSQIVNIVLYCTYSTLQGNSSTAGIDILLPFAMLWLLTQIHSQISATRSVDVDKNKSPTCPSRGRKSCGQDSYHQRQLHDITNQNDVDTTKCSPSGLIQRHDWIQLDPEDDSEADELRQAEEEQQQQPHLKKKKHKERSRASIHDAAHHSETDEGDENDEDVALLQTDNNGTELLSNNEWNMNLTNSEDCSDSSDLEEITGEHIVNSDDDDDDDDSMRATTKVTTFSCGKVSCIFWRSDELKKATLSMVEISSAIISKVEATSHTMDYFYFGIVVATVLALVPAAFRLCNFTLDVELRNSLPDAQHYSIFELSRSLIQKWPQTLASILDATFGAAFWERFINVTVCVQRWLLSALFFFLLSVAENTFKQRFLCAKLFTHLTSYRRAHQSKLPHFRLNKVQNIKTWLSIRSYLSQRGPQRSVDLIVSTAFVINLMLLAFLCIEILKESVALNSQYHVEALVWCMGLGVLLLRLMTLGNKINKKYRNMQILITEQINLHLQIEQKPHKKDELSLANNVLKLAIDLIKELQSNFTISGLSANSILYNVTKLIILSALSGVLSEVLGFKLKLHKIKIK